MNIFGYFLIFLVFNSFQRSDSKGAVMEPCPANVYIDYMLSWVQEELDDENVFPSQIGLDFLN